MLLYHIIQLIYLIGIYFEKSISFGTQENESILLGDNIKPFTGHPIDATISAIDYISKIK